MLPRQARQPSQLSGTKKRLMEGPPRPNWGSWHSRHLEEDDNMGKGVVTPWTVRGNDPPACSAGAEGQRLPAEAVGILVSGPVRGLGDGSIAGASEHGEGARPGPRQSPRASPRGHRAP